jgi:hypothetical protein
MVVLLDAMELCGGGFKLVMQTMFQEVPRRGRGLAARTLTELL